MSWYTSKRQLQWSRMVPVLSIFGFPCWFTIFLLLVNCSCTLKSYYDLVFCIVILFNISLTSMLLMLYSFKSFISNLYMHIWTSHSLSRCWDTCPSVLQQVEVPTHTAAPSGQCKNTGPICLYGFQHSSSSWVMLGLLGTGHKSQGVNTQAQLSTMKEGKLVDKYINFPVP